MFTLVCLFVLLLLLLCAVYIFKRRHLYYLSWQLPGPLALFPIIGNGFSLMCDSKDLLKQVLKLSDSYPSPFRLWIGPRLVIFIKDAEQLQTAMQSQKYTTKSFVYSFLTPFMGKGLFTSSGVKHKTERKLLQPLFGPKIYEGNSILFQTHAEKLVKNLEAFVDEGPFDVLHIVHNAAFEATMDILVEDKNNHAIDYSVCPGYIRRFYHIFSQRVITFWMYPDLLFKLTSFYKEQQKMVQIASTIIDDITNKQIPEIINRVTTNHKGKSLSNNENRTPSVLEMMVELVEENPDYLSREDFRDHMMTFVATSQDTQSSAIAFTLMMLGMHKNIQDCVVNELKEVLGGRKIVHFHDTLKLKYMEMCIKEAMRLFPLGPFLPRDVLEDFKLEKWTIPKSCSIILGVYNVHRDPKYWEKPTEFYPEHFENDVASKRHPYAYLAFSGGPRRCIAQQYSYVNMKIIIANILKNYTVDCPGKLKDMDLMTDVSIRPRNGYIIKITHREPKSDIIFNKPFLKKN